MRAPQDSTGRTISVGDRVKWRGQIYTIKAFGDPVGRVDTRTIEFEEPLHFDGEVPDEIAVDLVEKRAQLPPREEPTGRCCKLGCTAPLEHHALPFCSEHMKDEQLVRAWMDL